MRSVVLAILMLTLVGSFVFAVGEQETDPTDLDMEQDAPAVDTDTSMSDPGESTDDEGDMSESAAADPAEIDRSAWALDPADPVVAEAIRALGLSPYPEPIPLQDFRLPDLDGAKRTLGELEGTFVFLNFWATWCPPCREEMPSMQRLYEQYGGRGLEILAVSSMEDPRTVSDFVAENGYTFPILLDEDGRASNLYAIRAIPTTYLIDRAGFVLAGRPGGQDWASPAVIEAFATLIVLGGE
jgi:thiol-disulfide isomerase/thioredoxin